MEQAIEKNKIGKSLFLAYNKAESQGKRVFFPFLSKFYFFCRLKIQTGLNG